MNRFLSQLCSLQELSSSGDGKDAGLVCSSLSDKCQVLQGKLNRLIDALNEVCCGYSTLLWFDCVVPVAITPHPKQKYHYNICKAF